VCEPWHEMRDLFRIFCEHNYWDILMVYRPTGLYIHSSTQTD